MQFVLVIMMVVRALATVIKFHDGRRVVVSIFDRFPFNLRPSFGSIQKKKINFGPESINNKSLRPGKHCQFHLRAAGQEEEQGVEANNR